MKSDTNAPVARRRPPGGDLETKAQRKSALSAECIDKLVLNATTRNQEDAHR
jgi:hypothetical protein